MATDVSKILAATSGGLAYAGPTTTTGPTDASTALVAGFIELGVVSDAGLEESQNTSTTEIKNWAGVTVKQMITDTTFTFKFTLLQTDAAVLELFHGGSTVEANATTESKIDVKKTGTNRKSFVFDVQDGTSTVRIYVPSGEVTDVGAISYTSAAVAAYELTVTAYPDATSGVAMTKFFPTDLTA